MFVNTLLLAISSSIDSLGIGITYGLRKTRLSKAARKKETDHFHE